jgi:multidrug efflux pump subunit AcrB
MKVQNARGHMIPLKNTAFLEHTRGYAKIKRVDQKRVINVTADIITGQNNSRDVIHAIQKGMKKYMQQFPGYILKFGGEFEDTQQSLASLYQAFGLSILLIYMIMATTFKSFSQPFMLMISIPFAVIGVFVGLIVMRTPMGMMSFLGIIALTGIVVNDSIVLIDFINRRRTEASDEDRIEAVIQACKIRLRPILLTSITTIFGLIPLALGIFGREFMMTPMAISIVWGLSFSSLLTLLIIPCFYVILEDVKIRLWGGKYLKRALPADVIE